MSAFKYQWNQTIDVGTAGLLSKQWTSIRHILSLLVTANACVHVTAYVAVWRSLSTTYTAVVLGLLLRQYVSYQFGVWAVFYAKSRTVHSHDTRTADNYRLVNIKLNVRKHSMKFLGQPFATWSPWVYGCPNLLILLRISIKDIFMIQIWNIMIMNSIQYFRNFDNLLFHWATSSFLASSVDICILIDLLTYCDCYVFSERVNLHHLLTLLRCHSMAR